MKRNIERSEDPLEITAFHLVGRPRWLGRNIASAQIAAQKPPTSSPINVLRSFHLFSSLFALNLLVIGMGEPQALKETPLPCKKRDPWRWRDGFKRGTLKGLAATQRLHERVLALCLQQNRFGFLLA